MTPRASGEAIDPDAGEAPLPARPQMSGVLRPPRPAPPFPVPVLRSVRLLPGALGRLQPGLTVSEAQARLDALSAQLGRAYPSEYPAGAAWGLRLIPVEEDLVGNVRTELFVLFGAVGFVLLGN